MAAVRLFVCLITVLGACAQLEPERARPDVTGEQATVLPAPVPVPPPTDAEPPVRPEFLERVRLAGLDTTVVRARVQQLAVGRRSVPFAVWPEPEPRLIVTTATLAIDETLCGPPVGERADVSYVGGRSADGWLRTSLMPQDLSPGQSYVLMLTEEDGELFLVGGKYELVVALPEPSGTYSDIMGQRVTTADIVGACP